MISKIIILLPLAYFFGSVPWGVILTRLLADVDIRKAGSGNIGAYNVYRLVFLGFKGGKGVATVAGCFLIISPLVFGICALVYILILCIWGYSSASSLSAAAVLPGAIWLDLHSVPILCSAIIMTLLIYIRHADNIRRLIDGTEHSSPHSHHKGLKHRQKIVNCRRNFHRNHYYRQNPSIDLKKY